MLVSRSYSLNQEPRLGLQTVSALPDSVVRPQFDVQGLRNGILHLGCGAFHRAHQALATQHAITAEGPADMRWGITSTAMRRRSLLDSLLLQENLFTVLTRDRERVALEVCGSITELIHAPSEPFRLSSRLANPNTKIVTLTVTAGGYDLDPGTGVLDAESPRVLADAARTEAGPTTTVGILVRGLERVRAAGTRPPVILSCDNLASNGSTLHRALVDFAAMADDRLANWIRTEVQCPNTVSDRISQPTTPDVVTFVESQLGVHDAAPVPAEPYFGWVIEDFDGPRPQWEAAGARFVSSIKVHELSKLRLLNGSHMFLAYLGGLAGIQTIAEAVEDPAIRAAVRIFMLKEQGRGLPWSDHQLLTATAALLRRFENPAVEQTVSRIGRNGSEKMMGRVLGAMLENLDHGQKTPLRNSSLHPGSPCSIEPHEPAPRSRSFQVSGWTTLWLTN